MRILREYFIAVFISPEFLVIIIGIVGINFYRSCTQIAASMVVADEEIVKYFTLLPTAFFVWTSKESKKLLFPSKESAKILQEWNDYWRLKVHFKTALLYSFVFALMGWLVWIFGLKVNNASGFTLLVVSVVGGFITAVTVYFATISEQEILLKIECIELNYGFTDLAALGG